MRFHDWAPESDGEIGSFTIWSIGSTANRQRQKKMRAKVPSPQARAPEDGFCKAVVRDYCS